MSSIQSDRWLLKPLDELAHVGAGNPAPQDKKLFEGGKYPFIRTSDVGQIRFGEIGTAADLLNEQGVAKLRLVPKGTVLMPKSGASTFLNHRVMTTADAFVSSHLATITAKDGVTDPRYLLYALSQVAAQDLLPENSYPSLNLKLIRSIKIPLPPFEEQQRIVVVLDEALEALARARAHAEANLQNARELFENYRENFLAPSTRQGWSYRKLDDLITIKHGFAFKSAFFVDEGQYAVLTPGNYYETGGFRDRGKKQRYYSGEFPSEFLLRKGDLLMAMTEQAEGLLGSCMIVPEDEGYLHNQRLGLILPKDSVAWSPEYFSQAFNLKAFRKGLSDTCSGATVRHTSPRRILAESIPYSDNKAELEAVALHLAEREQDCRNLEKAYREKLQDIDDLRQSLLQKAFAGELT